MNGSDRTARSRPMLPIDVIGAYPPHGRTLGSLLAGRARAVPERAFIVFGGRSLSYAAFAGAAERWAAAFASRGTERGDRVGVMANNHPAIALCLFALARLGAIMVPVNPAFRVEEAAYVLGHADVSGVVCDPAAHAIADAALACGAPPARPRWTMRLPAEDASAAMFEPPVAGGTTPVPPDVGAPDDTVVLIYTSGTTGHPKGVMHSQSSAVLAGEAYVERMLVQPDERLLCILPMFHMNALFYLLCGALAAGATLVVAERFSASSFWRTVAQSRATLVNTIAAISNILIDRPRDEFVAEHSLRKMYGAPFSRRVCEAFAREFGVPDVIEGYGMSEIPGVLQNPIRGRRKIGSMGVPARHPDHSMPFSEVRVVDDAGRALPDGETGELAVRTPIVMQGYWRDPAQTAAAFRDGWFLTGDLGYRDRDGYFWFVGRRKDIIRRRGENVSGAELDRVIGEHPAVAEVATIAVPSVLGEDDILAAIVAKQGASADAHAIARWCRDRLAPTKQPRYIAFVDSLPHTPTHRVAKYKLRGDAGILRDAVDLQAPCHPAPGPS